MKLSRSITISGRKLTPYCCATVISATSARARVADASSIATRVDGLNLRMAFLR
jgi:hypothetical protein